MEYLPRDLIVHILTYTHNDGYDPEGNDIAYPERRSAIMLYCTCKSFGWLSTLYFRLRTMIGDYLLDSTVSLFGREEGDTRETWYRREYTGFTHIVCHSDGKRLTDYCSVMLTDEDYENEPPDGYVEFFVLTNKPVHHCVSNEYHSNRTDTMEDAKEGLGTDFTWKDIPRLLDMMYGYDYYSDDVDEALEGMTTEQLLTYRDDKAYSDEMVKCFLMTKYKRNEIDIDYVRSVTDDEIFIKSLMHEHSNKPLKVDRGYVYKVYHTWGTERLRHALRTREVTDPWRPY